MSSNRGKPDYWRDVAQLSNSPSLDGDSRRYCDLLLDCSQDDLTFKTTLDLIGLVNNTEDLSELCSYLSELSGLEESETREVILGIRRGKGRSELTGNVHKIVSAVVDLRTKNPYYLLIPHNKGKLSWYERDIVIKVIVTYFVVAFYGIILFWLLSS